MSDALKQAMARGVRKRKFERTGRISAYDPEIEPTDNELDDAQAVLDAIEAQEFVVMKWPPTPEMIAELLDNVTFGGDEIDIEPGVKAMIAAGKVD